MKTRGYKCIWICLMIILFAISGCKDKKVDSVVTVGDAKVGQVEAMLYILQTKAAFEKLAGADVWDIEDFSGGKTAQEVAKERAIDNLIQDQLLVSKAKGMGISLTDEEKALVEQDAGAYFDEQLPKTFIDEYKVTKELVVSVIMDSALASKVKQEVMNNYEPTEDQIKEHMGLLSPEYKAFSLHTPEENTYKVKVQYVMTKLAQEDENGEMVSLSDEEQAAALEQIEKAHDAALNGTDMEYLIELYSEDERKEETGGEYPLTLIGQPQEIQTVINQTEIGGITDIAKTENGYHFFKVLEYIEPTQEDIDAYLSWEKELYDLARSNLTEAAFKEILQEWKNETTIVIDQIKLDEMDSNNP